jgi:hypothetical protein
MNHGSVNQNGIEITLTQEAYCSNWGEYRASGKDDQGNRYEVIWDTTMAWDEAQAELKSNPEDVCLSFIEDESNACDWENPREVQAI